MPNPWFSNLHPEDRDRVDRQLQEHAQGDRDSVEFEYRFQTAGGEYRWMQIAVRAVEWDLQGRPVLVIGVTLDIDAAKHAEAHLRSSESMLETAAWGAGIGLWETNFITDKTRWFTTGASVMTSMPATERTTSSAGTPTCIRREGPEATRRFNEHVAARPSTTTPSTASRLSRAPGAGCFERGRVVDATRAARPCACSACAWIWTRRRSPSAAPTPATNASRRRCS
jgi:hypothetical protein